MTGDQRSMNIPSHREALTPRSPALQDWRRRWSATRASLSRMGVRGQLGPSVGRRQDGPPDRML